MTTIQKTKDLTKLSLEELIGSLMTYEINLNNHQRVEENKKIIAFKASTNDDEKEESENEDLDLITKKFIKSIKLENIKKKRKYHSREESSSSKKKKKAMVATWSESDEDSMEEEWTNEDANVCFMALEEHEDEVNSNFNYNEFQDVLQELHFDLEKHGLKMSLSRKIFLVFKMSSISLKKNLKILRRQKSLLKRKMRS